MFNDLITLDFVVLMLIGGREGIAIQALPARVTFYHYLSVFIIVVAPLFSLLLWWIYSPFLHAKWWTDRPILSLGCCSPHSCWTAGALLPAESCWQVREREMVCKLEGRSDRKHLIERSYCKWSKIYLMWNQWIDFLV